MDQIRIHPKQEGKGETEMSRDPFSVLGAFDPRHRGRNQPPIASWQEISPGRQRRIGGFGSENERDQRGLFRSAENSPQRRHVSPGGQQSQQQGGSYYGQRQQSGQGPGYGGFGFGDFGLETSASAAIGRAATARAPRRSFGRPAATSIPAIIRRPTAFCRR